MIWLKGTPEEAKVIVIRELKDLEQHKREHAEAIISNFWDYCCQRSSCD